uniref:EF-hand domain-containing protein n=1 Tax=Arion vulgaris TaxID=1028688 RepID=A0A0B7A5J2_9EUPU
MVMMVQQYYVVIVLYIVTLSSLLQPRGVLSQPQNQHHHGQQHQEQQPQEGHGHRHHGKPLEFASEIHNADHILEHLQKVVSTKSKDQMTEEELEFHYFKLHDYDNNNKLDGVEIGKALTHFHDENDEISDGSHHSRTYSDEEIAEVIDAALLSDDLDGDGYVEYPEFMAAQARRFEPEEVEEQMSLVEESLSRGHNRMPSQAPGHIAKPPGTF